MKVSVLLFAAARQAAGASTIEVEVHESASVQDLKSAVAGQFPSLAPILPRCHVAIDQNYAGEGDSVNATSEIALIPPVSGG